MSEEQTKTPEQLEAEELAILKRRATQLGVPYSPNIGLSTLRDRVNKANASTKTDDEAEEESVDKKDASAVLNETRSQRNARKRKEANKLYRVRITNHNPAKREHSGELFKAANSVIGTAARYVQFGEIWHVEKILLNMIEERKYQQFYTTTIDGKKVRKGKLVKEFGIEYLPALTPKELEELRKQQAMREGQSE